MAFIEIPGIIGKVYVPDDIPKERKKNPCKDCYSCQWCSDERCDLCLGRSGNCLKNTRS